MKLLSSRQQYQFDFGSFPACSAAPKRTGGKLLVLPTSFYGPTREVCLIMANHSSLCAIAMIWQHNHDQDMSATTSISEIRHHFKASV